MKKVTVEKCTTWKWDCPACNYSNEDYEPYFYVYCARCNSKYQSNCGKILNPR